ncbi:MAG: hypothetical protein VB049_06715 [Candidatus Pelethousia sp.]|nr:hypothetical protein [Candidatus Pelethousia sp.]
MRVLFVCTGNTCRSPMAQALFNQRARELGLPWIASSAGLAAEGQPLSGGARHALASRGLAACGHRSRQVSPALVLEADIILCMAAAQVETLQRDYPGAPIFLLGSHDITDPYGGTQSLYDSVMEEIDGCLDKLFQKLRAQAQNGEDGK